MSLQEEYFAWCLARPGVSRYVDAAGNRIHYLEWLGPANSPTVMLLHGFMGHAHWWDFIAPALAEYYRVLAMDLGGMGDSGHRETYALDGYVEEVAGAIRQSCVAPIYLVGHSFGGRCAILTAYRYPELLARAIAIDSRVSFPEPDRPRVFGPDTGRNKRRYPDLTGAKARFRLVPDEPETHPIILDHIAAHSLKQDGDAWIWKFDAGIVDRGPKPAVSDAQALPLLKVPLDYVCGEYSVVVPREHALKIAAANPMGRGPIVIPAAHHHLPIGQPVALLSTLRALLAV